MAHVHSQSDEPVHILLGHLCNRQNSSYLFADASLSRYSESNTLTFLCVA